MTIKNVSAFKEPKSVHVEFNLQKNGFQMVESDLLILRKSTQELLEQHFPKLCSLVHESLKMLLKKKKKKFIAKMLGKYYTQPYVFLKGFVTRVTTLKHSKKPCSKIDLCNLL